MNLHSSKLKWTSCFNILTGSLIRNIRLRQLKMMRQRLHCGCSLLDGPSTSADVHFPTSLNLPSILPDPALEPILAAVEIGVKRLVSRAFESTSSHRINELIKCVTIALYRSLVFGSTQSRSNYGLRSTISTARFGSLS